jgi:carboxymethylenebutenolidase
MIYAGLTASSITLKGNNGDEVEAYYARPAGPGPFPGIVVIHHAPGWDRWTTEVVHRFAGQGYTAISPHLYHRWGPGAPDGQRAGTFPA